MRIRQEEPNNFIEVPVENPFSTHFLDDFVHPEDYNDLVDKLDLKEKDIVMLGKWTVLQCQVFPDKGLPLHVYELEAYDSKYVCRKKEELGIKVKVKVSAYIIGQEFKRKQVAFISEGHERKILFQEILEF